MPTMNEIYAAHGDRYDELVSREDREGNLGRELERLVPAGAAVLELGAGTGRVTRLYAGRVRSALLCDRSAHMLGRARSNLSEFRDRLEFRVLDIREARSLEGPFDAVLEGWALGHCALEEYGRLGDFLRETLASLEALIAPGGRIVLVETLGSNTDRPAPPGEKLARIYGLLEEDHGFRRRVIRTDYEFPTLEEARRVLGFFFGPDMEGRISDRIVPEWTGIWVRQGG